jgi:hypothetical protein
VTGTLKGTPYGFDSMFILPSFVLLSESFTVSSPVFAISVLKLLWLLLLLSLRLPVSLLLMLPMPML